MRHQILSGLLVTAWAVAGMARGAPAPVPPHTLQAQDLFALQWISNPQIRPDGKAVAYLRQSNDIRSDQQVQSLWLVDVMTGAQTQLGSEEGSYASVRWSPDGESLAYLFAAADGPAHLVIRSMRTGKTTVIADQGETPHDIQWSPDGRSIAFIR